MKNIKLQLENGCFVWQNEVFVITDHFMLEDREYLIYDAQGSLQAGELVAGEQGQDLNLELEPAVKARLIQRMFTFSFDEEELEDSIFHLR